MKRFTSLLAVTLLLPNFGTGQQAFGELSGMTRTRVPSTVGLDDTNSGVNVDSVTAVDVNSNALGSDMKERYLYVTNGVGNGLYSIDMQDPTAPVAAGPLPGSSNFRLTDVAVAGDYAYTSYGITSGGYRVFSLNNPMAPAHIRSTGFGSAVKTVRALDLDGVLGLINENNRYMSFYSLSNPANPSSRGSLQALTNRNADAERNGNTLYVANGRLESDGNSASLRIYDISDLGNAVLLDNVEVPYDQDVTSLAYADGKVYLTHAGFEGGGGLLVIDVTDPSDAVQIASHTFVDAANSVEVQRDRAVVSCQSSGVHVLDISAAGTGTITETGNYPLSAICRDLVISEQYIFQNAGSEVVVLDGSAAGLEADPPILDIGEGAVVADDTVKVPVTVERFSNVSVAEFYIEYDPTKLTFDTLTSDAFSGPVFNDNDGTIILSWFSTTPLELVDGDTLLTLSFVNSGLDIDEVTPIAWQGSDSYLANFNGEVIEYTEYLDGAITGLGVFTISGRLGHYSSDIALAGATVSLSGDTSLTMQSDENGLFSFAEISIGSYTLTPELEDEGHPGVNTLDAYRIQKDIETLNPFTSGFELLAADVDLTDNVNTLDAFIIQRVVVGLDTDLESGDWGFVGSDYAMSTENWASANQVRSFALTNMDSLDQDFLGLRFGDTNNSWPNLFLGTDTDEEITGSMTIAEAVVSPGGTATVELRAEGLSDLGVIEYHIAFDPSVVTLQNVDLGALGGAVLSTTDDGIHVSWFDIQTPLNCGDRILGSFTFQAVNDVNVQSDIELTSVVLGDANGVELYTEQNDGSIMVSNTTGVNYEGAELVTDWELRPSYPNPFNAYTTLSFDVKDASEVQIHVYNVLGDLVQTLVQGNLPKGRYTKSVNANNWSSGTYFVVMKTQSFNKVQKIVLLK